MKTIFIPLLLAALIAGCATSSKSVDSTPKAPVAAASAATGNLSQLKTGQSTSQEVRSALGAPSQVSKDAIWGETWRYSRVQTMPGGKVQPALVSFGPDGKVWRVRTDIE